MTQQTAVSPIFVGRAEEVRVLDEALGRARAGEPQHLLLGGEAGLGKTRLVEEFLAAAAAEEAVTALGGCLELGGEGLPFAPFTTALRSLWRSLGSAELLRAAAGREAELARLLPEVGAAELLPAARAHQGDDPAADRTQLFELVAQLLEKLAAERALVLVLEDLHWADRSTRELLGYLYRVLQRGRILLCATYRADDIHRRHPLRPFLAEVERLRTVRHLELPALDRAEVEAQIAGIQGAEPEREMVETIFERSEGNPFFVEELTAECATCALSESLRDLLLTRVERLPAEAVQLLRLIAEAGTSVEYEVLTAVAQLPETELLEGLRAAVGAKILVPTDDGAGYRFRHALLREAVQEDLLPGEAAAVNRRYAAALEAAPELLPPAERTTRLARHWYRGKDAARALPAALAAAEVVAARFAFAEQRVLLERAVELWEAVPPSVRAGLRCGERRATHFPHDPEGPLTPVDLLAEGVVAARTAGENDRAMALVRRALELLDASREPLRCAWFWLKRALLTAALGRGDGSAECRRAEELARGLPPSPVHADIASTVASWAMLRAPGSDALRAAREAVELARLVGAPGPEVQARDTLGTMLAAAGESEEGLSQLRQARAEALALGSYTEVIRADINLSSSLEALGHSREAVEVAERGLEFAVERGRRNQFAFALLNQAESLFSCGEWTEAAERTERARRYPRSVATTGLTELRSGEHAVLTGDAAAATHALQQAKRAFGPQPYEPQQWLPLRALAVAEAAMRGDTHAVREETASACAEGFPPGTHRYTWPLLLASAGHEATVAGQPAAAEGRGEALDTLTEAARRLAHPAPVWEAYYLLVRGELARAQGRFEPRWWTEAEALLRELERPYLLAQCRLRRAEQLLHSRGLRAEGSAPASDAPGERPSIARLLAEVEESATALGAEPLRAEARGLAARAGVAGALASAPTAGSAVASGGSEAGGLTPREREVLRRVAAGRSNREIAEELFISPKTASVHVSHILAKLEVSSRVEATSVAFRLGLVDVALEGTAVPAGS